MRKQHGSPGRFGPRGRQAGASRAFFSRPQAPSRLLSPSSGSWACLVAHPVAKSRSGLHRGNGVGGSCAERFGERVCGRSFCCRGRRVCARLPPAQGPSWRRRRGAVRDERCIKRGRGRGDRCSSFSRRFGGADGNPPRSFPGGALFVLVLSPPRFSPPPLFFFFVALFAVSSCCSSVRGALGCSCDACASSRHASRVRAIVSERVRVSSAVHGVRG